LHCAVEHGNVSHPQAFIDSAGLKQEGSMATDWAADIKKFVPNADDDVIQGIISYCGISLTKRDSSLVAFKDPEELAKVKSSFLRKKLGLTDGDDILDAGIAAVGARMKGVNFKKRPTVYYLLLEHFGQLHMFKKGGATGAGAAAAAKAPLAAASVPKAVSAPAAKPAPAVEAMPVAKAAPAVSTAAPLAAAAVAATAVASGATPSAAYKSPRVGPANHFAMDDGKGGLGWILWLLAGLAFLWALWMLFSQDRSAVAPATTDSSITVPLTDDANATVAVPEPAPAAPVVIPTGAGVTSEVRDGKPLVKVYFDTGKSQVVEAFTPAAGTLKAYLDANPGSGLGVSGYNDPTGNAAANAELSKNRAQAVQAALVGAGIAATSIELIKPEAATDAQVTKEEARRVEVYIK
jgi:outer membrane protein OmpA-like peptidoglycan-associated protein